MSRQFFQGFASEMIKLAVAPGMPRPPGFIGQPNASQLRALKPNLLPGNPYEGLTKEQMQQPKLTFRTTPKQDDPKLSRSEITDDPGMMTPPGAKGTKGHARTTGHRPSNARPVDAHPGKAQKVVAKAEETPKNPFPSANVRPETPETQKVKFSEQSGVPSWASPPKGHKPTGKEYWEGGHTEAESTSAPTTAVKPSSAPVTVAAPAPAPTPVPEPTATPPATTGQEKPWSVSDIPGSHLAEPEVQRTVAAAKAERESAAKTGNWFKSGLF